MIKEKKTQISTNAHCTFRLYKAKQQPHTHLEYRHKMGKQFNLYKLRYYVNSKIDSI